MTNNRYLNGAGMRRRTWWPTTLTGLALLYLAMILTSIKTIESDLERRVTQRLSLGESDWVTVKLDGQGRDVMLTGVAPDVESRELVVEIVRNVFGVRAVDDRLEVGQSNRSPELSLWQEDGKVLLRGRVATQAAADLVVDAAEAVYGAEKVISELVIDGQLEAADWIAGASELFARLASARSAHLVIAGQQSRLIAEVRSHGERLKLVSAAKNLLGTGFETEIGVWQPPEALDVVQNRANPRRVAAVQDPMLEACQAELDRQLNGKRIYFATDTAELDPSSHSLLDQVIGVLEQCKKVVAANRLSITGYSIRRVADVADRTLSEHRAEAVKAYLVTAADAAGLVSRIRFAEASPGGLVDGVEGSAPKPAIGFILEQDLSGSEQ